jgi:predicted ribosome quality control (RQC) complex YloA/Tae2 family protein
MTSLDVAAVVYELKALEGGHVNKAYQMSESTFAISVHTKDAGRVNVFIELPNWIFISSAEVAPIEPPPSFIRGLRKHIMNAYVSSVEQHDFDRIVVFNLSKKENFQLVIELFSKGNIVLAKEGEILHPLRSQSWSHRMVKRGEPFNFPPARSNPLAMDFEDFQPLLSESAKDLVKTLAMDVNVGGELAEETCARAGLDKKCKSNELDGGQIQELFNVMKKMLIEGLSSPEPMMHYHEDKPVGFSPMLFANKESVKQEHVQSVSEAIEAYRKHVIEEAGPPDDAASEELERLDRLLEMQRTSIAEFEESIERDHAKGDIIYTNYQLLEGLLGRLKTAREAGSLDAMSEEFTSISMIQSVNSAKATVTIELDGMDIELHFLDNIHKNAERYYHASKKAREKMSGATEALKSTLKMKGSKETAAKKKAQAPKKVKPRNRKWFEKYRWFISSEGNMVIAGRDARSNELLVKKHLDFGDRYAHADIHGSPSVVVKGSCTDTTLKEACEFAAAFSKAWSAGIASVSTYWVLPEQVSKTPQSGEFVAKGSFIIRGKKNYFHKMGLAAAIGMVEYEGEKMLMCGPVSAVKSRSIKYITLSPGSMKKEVLAKKLVSVFDTHVDLVNGLLPPGSCDVGEKHGLNLD